MADLLKRKCDAIGCSSSGADGKTKLFAFPVGNSPKQIRRRQIWRAHAGITDSRKKGLLCWRHFENNQFRDRQKRYLVIGAMPTKYPGVPLVESTDLIMNFETVVVSNDCELFNRKKIEKETTVLEAELQNERDFSSSYSLMKVDSNIGLCKDHQTVACKMEIKEEPVSLNSDLHDGRDVLTDINDFGIFSDDFETSTSMEIKEEPEWSVS